MTLGLKLGLQGRSNTETLTVWASYNQLRNPRPETASFATGHVHAQCTSSCRVDATNLSGENLITMTRPDLHPTTTVEPDTAEQDGLNSDGSQSRFVPCQVIQQPSILTPGPKRELAPSSESSVA
jgi:hypothetical protein